MIQLIVYFVYRILDIIEMKPCYPIFNYNITKWHVWLYGLDDFVQLNILTKRHICSHCLQCPCYEMRNGKLKIMSCSY